MQVVKGDPCNQGSSCIMSLLVWASTKSCSTGHNLVTKGQLSREPIFTNGM
jgi:hypothetical protein